MNQRSIARSLRHFTLPLLLAALLAACSPAAPELTPTASAPMQAATATPAATTAEPVATVAPSLTAPPTQPPATATHSAATETTAPTATLPAAAPSITFTVTTDEMRFQPSELVVRAGETVHVDLENPDLLEHALVFADAGVSQTVAPGGTRSFDFAVNLPPGEYQMICNVVDEQGSHLSNGMVGTLVVEAAP